MHESWFRRCGSFSQLPLNLGILSVATPKYQSEIPRLLSGSMDPIPKNSERYDTRIMFQNNFAWLNPFRNWGNGFSTKDKSEPSQEIGVAPMDNGFDQHFSQWSNWRTIFARKTISYFPVTFQERKAHPDKNL
jgi:hypothetical protein